MRANVIKEMIGFLLFIFSSLSANSITDNSVLSRAERKAQKYLDRPFIAVPILKLEPETGVSMGLNTYYRFKMGKDTTNGLSILQSVVAYTTEKQFMAGVKGQLFGKKRRTILRFEGKYSYFPYKFWGIGNEIDIHQFAYYYPTIFELDAQYYIRIYKTLYIGLHGKAEDYHTLNFGSDFTRLITEPLQGLTGGKTVGPGWGIWQDSRDNVVNASKGLFLKVNQNLLGFMQAGDFNFTKTTIDARYFKKMKKKSVLAFQAYTELTQGDIPFFSMAFLGGEQLMRGYYNGAYRAQNMGAFQAEWRNAINQRLGWVAFASSGLIAQNNNDMFTQPLRYAGGIGFRYMFDKKNRLNARIDVSITKESRGVYFGIGEAF